jgi:hypothetical protein
MIMDAYDTKALLTCLEELSTKSTEILRRWKANEAVSREDLRGFAFLRYSKSAYLFYFGDELEKPANEIDASKKLAEAGKMKENKMKEEFGICIEYGEGENFEGYDLYLNRKFIGRFYSLEEAEKEADLITAAHEARNF